MNGPQDTSDTDTSRHMLRGGSWIDSRDIVRSARRGSWRGKTPQSGFRVVCDDDLLVARFSEAIKQ